jgi:hypothetical protein
MTNREIAESVFKTFSGKEGCQHIASNNALNGILNLISKYGCSTVFEVGIGIGTIPYALNKYVAENPGKKIKYTGIEENAFCLGQLKQNITGLDKNFDFSQHNVIDTVPQAFYELLIVDGANDSLEKIKRLCNPSARTILFVEGDRKNQVDILKKMFDNYIMFREVSTQRNPDYSPFPKHEFIHGYTVIIINPQGGDKSYRFARKVVTGVKYRIRQMKK